MKARLLVFGLLFLARSVRCQEQQIRPRAAAARLNRDAKTGNTGTSGPNLEVECKMRSVAFDMAMRVPVARQHAETIQESLLLSECPSVTAPIPSPEHRQPPTRAAGKALLYLDCDHGSDTNDGSKAFPFQTVHKAQATARLAPKPVTIEIRGMCYLQNTLVLEPQDSGTTWQAAEGEEPVFSGGLPLSGLKWQTSAHGHVLVADLPATVDAEQIDSLFALASPSSVRNQTRLVRARYPNGNSEKDRMPTNYDKLGGGVSSMQEWRQAGNVSFRIPTLKRNASFYPWFGHSRDLRWVLDYHTENASSIYSPQRQFWQATVGTAAKYNASTFSPRVHKWTRVQDAVIHMIHYDWWGNWQWQLADVDVSTQTLSFGEGGWQDAHGGPVSHNYFFVENVLEELDVEGEWYVDKDARKVYFWPPSSLQGVGSNWHLVAAQLSEVVQLKGTVASPVRDVTVHGITFAHTTTTFLAERYSIPSAGDWSVLPKGSVTLSGAVGISMTSCRWVQVGGNALAFSGHVRNTSVTNGDFIKPGDSGIVSVGELPKEVPYDGTSAQTYPQNITISNCHFGGNGVFGKQTSALFIAVSKQIQFTDNVLYDGPRAGVNINDGFGGGHLLARNVIFNHLLESGDHGPVNTWSRTAYLHPTLDGHQSTIPEWNRIDSNFVMVGPKFGSLYGPGDGPCSNGSPEFLCPKKGGSMFTCLDHDDGSDYYLDTRNVCVFAGMKNYIGQNKIWDSNLIAYADGALSQNRSGMPSVWTSMNMAGDKSKLPCTAITGPCRNREVFTNNTCITHRFQPSEYDMFNATDLDLMGPEDTTMPFTARNKYYLGIPYQFAGQWNLSEAQAHGVDRGSEVFPEMNPSDLEKAVRKLLSL